MIAPSRGNRPRRAHKSGSRPPKLLKRKYLKAEFQLPLKVMDADEMARLALHPHNDAGALDADGLLKDASLMDWPDSPTKADSTAATLLRSDDSGDMDENSQEIRDKPDPQTGISAASRPVRPAAGKNPHVNNNPLANNKYMRGTLKPDVARLFGVKSSVTAAGSTVDAARIAGGSRKGPVKNSNGLFATFALQSSRRVINSPPPTNSSPQPVSGKRPRTLSNPESPSAKRHASVAAKKSNRADDDADRGFGFLTTEDENPFTDLTNDDSNEAEDVGDDDDEEAEADDEDEQVKKYWDATKKARKERKSKRRTEDKRTEDVRRTFTYGTHRREGGIEVAGRYCNICVLKHGKSSNSFFVGSVTTCRAHISRSGGQHWENYKTKCETAGIMPHPAAFPKKKPETGLQDISTFATRVEAPHDWKADGLLDAITEFIIDADVAIRVVERQSFRRLLMYQRPKTKEGEIPRRTTVTESINAKAKQLEISDRESLKAIDSLISLTHDGWTSANGSPFLSITIHYIGSKPNEPNAWILKSQLLNLKPHTGDHSGENIACHLVEELIKYGLEEKVAWMVADNVSANDVATKCTCKKLDPDGKRLDPKKVRGCCLEHIIHLAAAHFVKGVSGVPDDGTGEVDKSMEVEGEESEDEGEEEGEEPVQPQAGLDSDDEDSKAGDVIRASPQASEFLKELQIKKGLGTNQLLTWVRTRWASLYNCFGRLLKLRPALQEFTLLADHSSDVPKLKKKKYHDYHLNDDEWTLLALMHEVLEEPATAQQSLSSERISTVGRALPVLEELQSKWESMRKDPKFKPVEAGLERGLANIRKWYEKTDNTDMYFIAMVLDPRVKMLYFEEMWDVEWVNKGKKRLEEVFKKYSEKYAPPSSTETPATEDQPTKGYDEGWVNFRIRQRQAEMAKTGGARLARSSELETYMMSPVEPDSPGFDMIAWWGLHTAAYPILSRIARDYLAIPGSAVPSERVFSSAALTDVPRRNRLTHELFSSCQALKDAYRDGRMAAIQVSGAGTAPDFAPSVLT